MSKLNIIGICGKAGSGKDTTAMILVRERGYVVVALADAMKRFLVEVYGFTEEQLWGPSEKRNAPDFRYPRPGADAKAARRRFVDLMSDVFIDLGEMLGDPLTIRQAHLRQAYDLACTRLVEDRRVTQNKTDASEAKEAAEHGWLTPRYALQQLGTEWGRNCYLDTWINIVVRIAKELLLKETDKHETDIPQYTPMGGLFYVDSCTQPNRPAGVIVPDIRYPNEGEAIQMVGGRIIKLFRPEAGLAGAAGQHTSENAIGQVKEDVLLYNDGSLVDLRDRVMAVMS